MLYPTCAVILFMSYLYYVNLFITYFNNNNDVFIIFKFFKFF